jgi:hypothetical protein
MLSTYWQISNRILEEEQCVGYGGQPFMHSHAHNHQYSHHHYPINYSSDFSDLEMGNSVVQEQHEKHGKIRTPQPKRMAKNVFKDDEDNQQNEIITITKSEASKLSATSTTAYNLTNKHMISDSYHSSNSSSIVSADYKSLQISPLDFCALQRDAKNIF